MSERRIEARTVPLWVAALLLAALLAGVAAYFLFRDREPDPIASLVTTFQKQNSLTVFRAQTATVTTSEQKRLLGFATVQQTAIIPATIEYRLDLSRLGTNSVRWDAERQRATVTLPPLTIERPNLDERRARYIRKGVLVSAESQEALSRVNTQAAEREALRTARSPELLKLARAAAREAMAANVEVPLRAAGFDRVEVVVRFPDDPGGLPERWDTSRSPEAVLRDADAR